MRTIQKLSLGLVAIAFAAAIWAYPLLPESIITHWNAAGQPDGQMPKAVGLFLLPGMLAVIFAALICFPRIDPKAENYGLFTREYDIFTAAIMGFLLYVHALSIGANMGLQFSMTQALAPGLAGLLFATGILIEKAKRNYFVGIRTPWTLASDKVWDRTHRLGGRLFKAAGSVALIGLVMPAEGLFAMLAVLIAAAIALFAYSYLEYRKLGKK